MKEMEERKRKIDYDLARIIDHTQLAPEARRHDIERVCDETIQFGFASACVNPVWVPLVRQRLDGHPSRVCCVIDFPFGAAGASIKEESARWAAEQGADEIDMVADLGAILDADWNTVRGGIERVRKAIGSCTLKVILETAAIGTESAREAARVAASAGADFLKTSTGYHSAGGATVEAIEVLRAAVPEGVAVKASGGIRNADQARALLAAGAARLGTSRSLDIIIGTI
jgi:deoxyribose-phosphate aldolase